MIIYKTKNGKDINKPKNKTENNLLKFTRYYTQTRNFNETLNNLINGFKEVHSPIKEYVYNKISESEGL